MTQEIITFLILLIALSMAVRNIIRFFTNKAPKCSNCPLAKQGCKIPEHKFNFQKKQLPEQSKTG